MNRRRRTAPPRHSWGYRARAGGRGFTSRWEGGTCGIGGAQTGLEGGSGGVGGWHRPGSKGAQAAEQTSRSEGVGGKGGRNKG